jgi:hypothetical protein
MILDSLLQFSDAQALTVTAVSTNVIDLSLDRDIGIGEPMALVVTVGVAADFTTTDETYQVTLQTATDAAFTSPVTVVSSAAINGDELPAGAKIVLPIGHTNLEFLRVNYTLAGTTPTATVDAYLQPLNMIDGTVDYANGYTIV